MSLPKKQSSKTQKQEMEVHYHVVSAEPEEVERCVNHAFDLLFEAVQKEIESNQKTP